MDFNDPVWKHEMMGRSKEELVEYIKRVGEESNYYRDELLKLKEKIKKEG